MNRDEVCARIREVGIVPAIRVSTSDDALFAAHEMAAGGIPIVEITMTTAGAVDIIAKLVRDSPGLLVGAGTVLDAATGSRCIKAGARFITAPGLNRGVVEFAAAEGIAAIPGALTPTEVVDAWMSGADLVKVFPCSSLGGDKYIRALKASFPQIGMIAAGGVNQQTAAHFIQAGAAAIGVGAELIPTDAIRMRQADRIHELARRFLRFVREARQEMAGVTPWPEARYA
jgi:2-dehydro-3-deoxyphosphogluconate aldolase/(4S)-4-hydroxy-2-oxoglutarate aldolase